MGAPDRAKEVVDVEQGQNSEMRKQGKLNLCAGLKLNPLCGSFALAACDVWSRLVLLQCRKGVRLFWWLCMFFLHRQRVPPLGLLSLPWLVHRCYSSSAS